MIPSVIRLHAAHSLGIEASSRSFHVGVFIEPYLSDILSGRKTVETRLTRTKVAPFGMAHAGDVVFLKRQSGPVVGAFSIREAFYYRVSTGTLYRIIEECGDALTEDDVSFLRGRQGGGFLSIIKIESVIKLPAVGVEKSDRRGWVVIDKTADQMEFLY